MFATYERNKSPTQKNVRFFFISPLSPTDIHHTHIPFFWDEIFAKMCFQFSGEKNRNHNREIITSIRSITTGIRSNCVASFCFVHTHSHTHVRNKAINLRITIETVQTNNKMNNLFIL